MPFSKKSDSKNARLADNRKIFIGRANELAFFEENILLPENPTHNIISVSGTDGVGKSTLLIQFMEMTRGSKFKDYCTTAWVGERQTTTVSIMVKFANQLRHAGYTFVEFEGVLRHYMDKLQNMPVGHIVEQEKSFSSEMLKIKNSLSDDIFQEDMAKRDKVDINSDYLYYLFEDAKRFQDPISELTKAFIDDLNRLADTPIVFGVNRTRHEPRVLLFFDPFEQLVDYTVPWLLDHFLEEVISLNVVLIVAGCVPIERSFPRYSRRWQNYRSGIYPIPLKSFTKDETEEYLRAQDITEPNRVAAIWQSTHGFPSDLELLTSNSSGEFDVAKNLVENILSNISEDEEVKRKLVLDAALLSRSFNQDDLKAFPYLTDSDRPLLYRWLCEQAFVMSEQDGRYSYRDFVRENFSNCLYQTSPTQCQNTRKTIADHYRSLLDKNRAEEGKEFYRSSEYLELVLALVKQLFLLPDEDSHISAIGHILRAYEYAKRLQDVEIMRLLRDVSREESANQVNTDARRTAKYLLQYIEVDPKRQHQELLAAISFLLQKTASQLSFPSNLRARIYLRKAKSYELSDNTKEIIDECTHALRCDSSIAEAYILRGQAYFRLDCFEKALDDFKQVIENGSETDREAAFFCRGQTYSFSKRYEEALHDFESVIILNSSLKHAALGEKGRILYVKGKYQEAIEIFTEALVH